MSILLSLLLSQARVLPEIDRRALDLQARAEALQSRRPTTAVQAQPRPAPAAAPQQRAIQQAAAPARLPAQQVTVQMRQPVLEVAAQTRRPVQQAAVETRRAVQQAAAQTRRPVEPQMQRPASIRRASTGALDLSAITTICRAAGNQADPATFLTTLTRAYSLDSRESQSLRTSCAAYLAGRADARVNNYGAPAH
jgi:hypothetical protein